MPKKLLLVAVAILLPACGNHQISLTGLGVPQAALRSAPVPVVHSAPPAEEILPNVTPPYIEEEALCVDEEFAMPELPLRYPSVSAGQSLEFNNQNKIFNFVWDGSTPMAAREIGIEYATYAAANGLEIRVDDNVVLRVCTLSTSSYGDPTKGLTRPPEDSIRTFAIKVPAGSRNIEVISMGSTPMYLRMNGMNGFQSENIAPSILGTKFRIFEPAQICILPRN